MDNLCPEETQYQSVTYTIGESLVREFHVSHCDCNRNFHGGLTEDLGKQESGRVMMFQI